MAVGVKPQRTTDRFTIGYVILGVAVVIAALVLAVQLGDSKTTVAPDTWSAWKPNPALGVNGIVEIADHVGQRYTLADGNQLVVIKASYPGHVGELDPSAVRAKTLDVSTLVIANTAPDGQVSYTAGFPTFPTTVEYQLCGASPKCRIPGGMTAKTQAKLHREGLELALYTFHYIPELTNVVEIFPPGPGGKPSRAVVLGSSQLAAVLQAPLGATLPAKPVAGEQASISRLMTASTYDYLYQQLYDGTFQMVLSTPNS